MLSAMDRTRSPAVDRRALLCTEVGRFRPARAAGCSTCRCTSVSSAATGTGAWSGQDLPAVDAALRADVVSALLEDAPPDWCTAWLLRPGTPEPHDLDLQWLAARGE